VLNAITLPRGFRAAGIACGIKPGRPDLALIAADHSCAAAGVFTTNFAPAAPVTLSRRNMASGRARAVVANAGCANAATGAQGMEDARRMAALVAAGLGCAPEEIVVASTGVIGVPLPMEKVSAGILLALAALAADGGAGAARAILTTDTRSKEAGAEFTLGAHRVRIGAMAKGAGMIAPRMATMLAFFTTDVAIEAGPLRMALADAVGESLNRVTVDGDTSTNDMAVILASSLAGNDMIRGPGAAYDAFRDALSSVAREIAGHDRARRRGRDARRRSADRGRAQRRGRGPHRTHRRRIAAGEDRAPWRRSQLGPRAGRGRALGRGGGREPRRHLPRRRVGRGGRQRARLLGGAGARRAGRGGSGAHPRRSPRRPGFELDADQRHQQGLRRHQRQLPELATSGAGR
jgi:hypothetical protein